MPLLTLIIGFIIGVKLQKRCSLHYVQRYKKEVYKLPSKLSSEEKSWVTKVADDIIEVIKMF